MTSLKRKQEFVTKEMKIASKALKIILRTSKLNNEALADIAVDSYDLTKVPHNLETLIFKKPESYRNTFDINFSNINISSRCFNCGCASSKPETILVDQKPRPSWVFICESCL